MGKNPKKFLAYRLFCLILVGLVLVFLTPNTPALAAGRQLIKGHVPEALATASKAGSVPYSTQLRLAIGLPLKNLAELQVLLEEIYDLHSPRYHQFLTPDQFTQRFGPSLADYQAVVAFAESAGLKVEATYPNRLLVDVSGTASDISRAFNVRLDYYHRPDGSLFYASNVEPSVDLDVPLLHVSGLENLHRPYPKFRKGPKRGPKIGTGASGYYQGLDFRDIYAPNVPATINGAGQTVALVEFNGFFQSDISYYQSSSNPSFSAPAPQTVLCDLFNGIPVTANNNELGDNDEVSLDIEMVNAMAPGAQVLVFEGPDQSNLNQTQYDTAADDIFTAIVGKPQCQQISCSWGGFGDSSTAQALTQMAAQGQGYYEASGDVGSFVSPCNSFSDPNNQDPSLYLSPYETLVGGTQVNTPLTGPPVWSSETSWNDDLGAGSGGICGPLLPTPLSIPSYQSSVPMGTNGGSTQYRNMPDVSMNAVSIFVVSENQGYAGLIEGTSAASPLWAAYSALANQQAAVSGKGPIGFANPSFYAIGLGANYSSDFHDVSDGSNNYYCYTTTPTPGPYKAVTGYDLSTGWGSPKGQSLINDLAAGPPTQTPTPTFTSTSTPCGYPSNTCTLTPTFTPTATPPFLLAPLGKLTLAPNLVSGGVPICLFLDKAISGSQWDVYNVAGERTAHLSFGSEKACWGHPNLASGLYLVRVRVVYLDGTTGDKIFKIILI